MLLPLPLLHIIQQIIQIVLVVPVRPSHNLWSSHALPRLLFVFCQRGQHLLQLILGDFGSELTGTCKPDQTILDIFGARCFDQSYSSKSICCSRLEDLVQYGRSLFLLLFTLIVLSSFTTIATATATATTGLPSALLLELRETCCSDLVMVRIGTGLAEEVTHLG